MDIGRLSGFDVFADIPEESLARVLDLGEMLKFSRNAVILEESGKSADLFLLVSGRVSVEMEMAGHGNAGRRDLLVRLRPGDVFGEMAFLEHTRRSAYVVANDDISCLKLNGDMLKNLLEEDTALGYLFMRNLARILAHRLVDSNFRWRNEVVGPRI